MPKFIIFAFLLLLCCLGFSAPVLAQAEETIDVKTRVVFVDALVRDKRTGGVVADLKQDSFEVLDEGRPRSLSYFSRDGDANRKPLALVLVLDVSRYGASRFLKRAEIIEAMTKELSRLPASDEVAVFMCGSTYARDGWLTTLTSDRAQIAAALARVPSIIEQDARNAPPARDGKSDSPRGTGEADAEVESRTVTRGEHNETITRTIYKNGETITQTIYWNGRMYSIKRAKDGTEIELYDYVSPLARATAETVRLAAEQRPASQAAIVWVSDGIDPVYKVEQKEAAARLLRQGVIFNALVAEMNLGFKLFKPVLVPLGNAIGMSAYGTASRLARETGGVTLRVRRPEDYARGLGKIVGDLAGRYSLGFTLATDEPADNRLRQIEVRVNARDAKGKRRKIEVAARRGYFVPDAKQ